jgi:hypothetical protein
MKRKSFDNALYLIAAAVAMLLPAFTADAQSRPSVSTTFVISQAYGGGGGTTGTYLNDYVELKNISTSPQSLNGLSLMYGSATGQFGSVATNVYPLANVTVQPGKFYLVQLSAAGTVGAALPVTPDEVTTNLTMGGQNGKVALVTSAFPANTCGATATPCTLPNENIIDLVAWGIANNAEGGAATNAGASITSTQGNVRKNNGCTDTDNNNADFDIITAPVPRNSASAASACGTTVVHDAPADFNGDGKTDFSVARNAGGVNGQLTWYTLFNGTGTFTSDQWGLASDKITPGDYDGDGKDDICIWRPGPTGTSGFYILQSGNGAFRFVQFGQSNDDPFVVRDYTGDGIDDPAIYRQGTQSTFWYLASSGPLVGVPVAAQWGTTGDAPCPGDYTGDGKADFCVFRNVGGQGVFFVHPGTGGPDVPGDDVITYFGLGMDTIVPGDYDGDGKADLAVTRAQGNQFAWYYLASSNGAFVSNLWGLNATDFEVQGDYDGDGKTDIAVWRTSGTPTFFALGSQTGQPIYASWGLSGDIPIALDVH